MGQDKALMLIEGIPLLTRVCEVGLQCAPHVYIVTPWASRYQKIVPPTCHLVKEHPLPGGRGSHGPLVGFAQGLIQVKTDWVLLLACDLPCLSLEMLHQWMQRLPTTPIEVAALLPKTEYGWEPLCGFYRANCLPRLQAAIEKGERSFQRWLASELIEVLPLNDRSALFNCNTPEDLRWLLESL